MDEATRLRIFEPFFTTKEVGRGTVSGSPWHTASLKQHGGDIMVTSVPDQGTSFRVYLPLLNPADAKEQK